MGVKAYVVVTGLLFLALFVAHVARVVVEGPGPLSQPIFATTSILALAMAAWAVVVVRQLRKSRR